MKPLISASILSADFSKINEEIKSIENYVDFIHVDVMDGRFVPNLTFGASAMAKFKCTKPMDVHLMIEKPENYLEDFAKAITSAHGRRNDCYITVHREACVDLPHAIGQIKKLGCLAGVSIKPATLLQTIEAVLNSCDLVLLMTVNPGFGGQAFMDSVVPKIRELRAKAPQLNIAVDGGIDDKTAKIALGAGANILVTGSYIFKAKNRKEVIERLS